MTDGQIVTRIESLVYRSPGSRLGVCGFCGGTLDPSAHARLQANWRDLLNDDPDNALSLLEKNNRKAVRARKRCDRLGGPPE